MSLFTDDFMRTCNALGPGWHTSFSPVTSVTGATIYAQMTCSNKLRFQWVSGTVFSAVEYVIFPLILVNDDTVVDAAQFAEVTVSADNSSGGQNTNQWGPGVFLAPSINPTASARPLGYMMLYTPNTGGWSVRRSTTINFVTIFSGTGAFFSPGDVFRLEVTPSGGSNFVELFINGGSVGSATDSDATRPTSGYPGFYMRTLDHTGTTVTDISEFQGGSL